VAPVDCTVDRESVERLQWQRLLRQAIGLTTPADPLFDRLARALAGRYTLVRELGRGGMATVYLGTDVKLGRGVAIKLLAPATRAYLGSDRFQQEVLLAAQLSHPHIVPLFEADEADGLLFYVMEYVEGESLRQRLSRHGPLPVDDAVRIAAEVGDAVLYEMLAGEPPFTGPSAQAIAARVLNDPPRPIRTVRPGLPVHLERALARGLAKSPADRHRTARAFVDALAAPAPERRAPTRPFRWIATAFGAAILGWIVWRGSRVHPPPGMVLVPAGLYPVGGGGRGGPSRDSTAVQLDAYFIDSAEVGVAAYRRFLDATRAGPPWTQAPPDQLPVTGILWSEASAYCAWRQRGGRLPTEDEWEAAARGPPGPASVAYPHRVPLRAQRRRGAGARGRTLERRRPVLRDAGHGERLPRGRAHRGDHHQPWPSRATQRKVPQRRAPLSGSGG